MKYIQLIQDNPHMDGLTKSDHRLNAQFCISSSSLVLKMHGILLGQRKSKESILVLAPVLHEGRIMISSSRSVVVYPSHVVMGWHSGDECEILRLCSRYHIASYSWRTSELWRQKGGMKNSV